MNCNIKPYNGEKNYIFVSFAYQDGARVFPVLEKLGRIGYRVWYDDRTHKDDYWTEMIADKLVKASICLAFVSQKSIRVHSVRKQINYAVLGNIPTVLVLVDEIQTTLAMRMQFSMLSRVSLEEFSYDNSVLDVICKEAPSCRGKENPEIDIQDWSLWRPDIDNSSHENSYVLNEWLIHDRMQEAMEIKSTKMDSVQDLAENHRLTAILPPKKFLITRDSTGEKQSILTETFLIGASDDSDFRILDNPHISGHHARILAYPRPGRAILYDEHSPNGTFVNDIFVQPGGRYELHDMDVIYLANETFTFRIVEQE